MLANELKAATKPPERISVEFLSKGTKIITAGKTVGIITGRQTKECIEIRVSNDKSVGEYDWISKLATVERI